MPSERIQRQIDRLLDEAEAALTRLDWDGLRAQANAVLALDPENADARTFLDAAVRSGAGTPSTTESQPAAVSEAPSAPPLPASFAAGRYTVQSFLGEGAKKRVYLAHDTKLARDVAFALIKTDGLDATGRERTLREAQSMARLGAHPNIITVHDIGEDAGAPYFVMELMQRGAVDAALGDGALPLERTLAIACDVCRALEFAHGQGVIHRDLKPGNVWLAEAGAAQIGDFGLAVSLDRSRLTQHGMMIGTVAYMPPEQALGGDVTPQADFYALGAMLYEMVTGRPPFLGDDPTAVISQHINVPPVAPSWLTEHCPPDLEELILRLLAKDPAERPASAAEVLSVLERVDPGQKSASHADGANPLERLARGVFVGRQKELERLRKAFDEAFAGRGGIVMLVGEPGIGKTRAAHEVETYARVRGAQSLWGRAHESSGVPAYWPWMEVGEAYRAARGLVEVGPAMEGKNQFLGGIFPWVRQQPAYVEPEPLADPEAAQFRLFDAFLALVRAMSGQVPLLILLDDLHWADKPSLLLLQHVARELSRMRVLVVCTYRDTDLSRTHPLSEALARLNREAGFDRIVLRGLSRDEVAAYIRAAASVEPKRELIDRIFEETEGNPFFLSEVVNLMAQEGKLTAESVSDIAIPDGVREALGRRLDRISEEANELLQTAAVVGREFNYEMLSLTGERGDDELLRLVEEALEARVIEEADRPGRYRFTHALMQETLLQELSTTRRVRLHGTVGEAMERRYGAHADERASRLALHFVEAAMVTPRHAAKAVHYSKLAALQAEAQFAWDEAAQQYERCLTLVSEAEDRLGEDEAGLLTALGRCARDDGQYRPAWRALMRALTLYRQRGDGVGFARAYLEADLVPAPPERKVPMLREAIELLGAGDSHLEAQLLSLAPFMGRRFGSEEQVEAARRRASELVAEHGFADVEATLVNVESMLAWRNGEVARGIELLGEVFERRARLGLVRLAAGNAWLASIRILAPGSLDEGRAAAEKALAYAQAHHMRFQEENSAALLLALLLVRCDFAGFDALAAERASDASWVVTALRATRAEIAGDLDAALALLPEPAAAGGNPDQLTLVHGTRARVLANAGQFDRARQELVALRAAWDTADSPVYEGVAIDMGGLAALDEALTQIADGVLLRAIDAYQRGEPLAPQLNYQALAGRTIQRIYGDVALRLDQLEDAEALYRTGLEWCERERCPIEAGRCLAGLAEVAERRGDAAEALSLLDRAAVLFRQHGAKLYLDRVIAAKVRLQGVGSGQGRSIDAVLASVQSEHPDLAPMASPDGSITIMFTDIENSTALTEQLGDAQWIDLLREHNTVVEGEVQTHGGKVVKNRGDGYMLVFRRPDRGLDCAVAIQQALVGHEVLRVRIGLHIGNPVREGNDFFGTDVNLASRIADSAHGGEIVVSSRVRELVAEADGMTFGEPGQIELKGLSGRHSVYAVNWLTD
jgi:class 3 adenylate cyclase